MQGECIIHQLEGYGKSHIMVFTTQVNQGKSEQFSIAVLSLLESPLIKSC